eukprot:m.34118 g.34118  ORF g.34118 m.34118 type:complete len:249 (+) comp9903_c0_seq2:899-1645(+)
MFGWCQANIIYCYILFEQMNFSMFFSHIVYCCIVVFVDYELNQSLSKTMLSARDMHYRSERVDADEQLLQVLGWSKRKQQRFFDIFHAYSQSPHMTYDSFTAFLKTQGISLKHAVPLFRAFDRRNNGTWLSAGDFVIGAASCMVDTPHKGAWLRVRLGGLFRFYSSNGRKLSIDQLTDFVTECKATHRIFRFVARYPNGQVVPIEDPLRIAEYIMDEQSFMSQTDFVSLGLQHGLPVCENLLRFPFDV